MSQIEKLTEKEFKEIKPYVSVGWIKRFPGQKLWTKIEPIKLLRKRTSLGLREAKEAVEFAIEKFIEVGLGWEDYNTNFELWAETAAPPVVMSKDSNTGMFYVTCPCGCLRRFQVAVPEEEVYTTPIIDDDAEPLVEDPDGHLEELDKARAERWQEEVHIVKGEGIRRALRNANTSSRYFCPAHDVLFDGVISLERHLTDVAHSQEELDEIGG